MSALFHVTHAKAGSTWLYKIFHNAFPDRIAPRVGGQLQKIEIKADAIQSAVFCDRKDYLSIEGVENAKCFFVMRDIRDSLISLYFSLRYSHGDNPNVRKAREKLKEMSEEEAILAIFKKSHKNLCKIQASWVKSGEPVYRYEDLFETEGQLLLQILDDIGFSYDRGHLKRVIREHTFEKEFKRKPGVTDIHSHGRSGLPGGWQEFRNAELDAAIEEFLADHLALTGYDL